MTATRAPCVSIVVPNYNHAHFLRQRLDSVLSQSFRDFELIILDDASTDNSRKIISDYLSEPRVRFAPNEFNSGSPFVQWNHGVALARGEFVWIAESDDFAEPSLLATLVARLRNDPAMGLCYCQSHHVDENDVNHGGLWGWTDDLAPGRWRTSYMNDGRDECARFFLLKNPILNASGVVFRREVFLRAGGAPSDMRVCGDWLTWVRMLRISSVGYDAQALNYFRTHANNVRSSTAAVTFYCECCRVQRFVLRHLQVAPAIRRDLCWRTLQALRTVLINSRGSMRDVTQCVVATMPIFARDPVVWLRTLLTAAGRRCLNRATRS